MSDLTLVAAAAALAVLLLWRAARPRLRTVADARAVAAMAFAQGGGGAPTDLHHWPAQDRFDFEIVESESCQQALRSAMQLHGPHCTATLYTGKEVGGRVEVRVDEHRVGFLSDGDASRFQRRLAYEGRPGQTSQCGARIVSRSDGARQTWAILLDLKPFRH
ncbi:MAG TPA: hypothetical protein VMS38_15445 [Pseudorhodoferax sp.]|jgi:hypothetical protein|nr:hypothetical protein [Pseudorhodoferax sp.]